MLAEMEWIRFCKINTLFCPEPPAPSSQHCTTGGCGGGRAKLTPVRKRFPERAQISFASKTRRAFILQAPDPRRPHNRICDRPCPISAFFFPNPVSPGWVLAGGCRLVGAGCSMPAGGCRPLDAGCSRSGGGCWAVDAGCSKPAARGRLVDAGWWMPAAGCRLAGAAWRVPAGGFRPVGGLPAGGCRRLADYAGITTRPVFLV